MTNLKIHINNASHVVMLVYKGIHFVYLVDEKTHEIYTHLRRSAYSFQLFKTLSTLGQLIYASEDSLSALKLYEETVNQMKETIKKTS